MCVGQRRLAWLSSCLCSFPCLPAAKDLSGSVSLARSKVVFFASDRSAAIPECPLHEVLRLLHIQAGLDLSNMGLFGVVAGLSAVSRPVLERGGHQTLLVLLAVRDYAVESACLRAVLIQSVDDGCVIVGVTSIGGAA